MCRHTDLNAYLILKVLSPRKADDLVLWTIPLFATSTRKTVSNINSKQLYHCQVKLCSCSRVTVIDSHWGCSQVHPWEGNIGHLLSGLHWILGLVVPLTPGQSWFCGAQSVGFFPWEADTLLCCVVRLPGCFCHEPATGHLSPGHILPSTLLGNHFKGACFSVGELTTLSWETWQHVVTDLEIGTSSYELRGKPCCFLQCPPVYAFPSKNLQCYFCLVLTTILPRGQVGVMDNDSWSDVKWIVPLCWSEMIALKFRETLKRNVTQVDATQKC